MKNKYAVYFAMESKLKKQGHHVERSTLIKEFTKGNKDSLKALGAMEYRAFLEWLNAHASGSTSRTKDSTQGSNQLFTGKSNRMRRKIIGLFRSMGYEKGGKADMPRIYQWVKHYGYLHKPLNDYQASELQGLVSQAEKAYRSFEKNILHQKIK